MSLSEIPDRADETTRVDSTELPDWFAAATSEFCDEAYLAVEAGDPVGRMVTAPPRPTDDRLFDGYLAAMVEHLSTRWSLVPPAWILDPIRSGPSVPWFAFDGQARPLLFVSSPPAFPRRNLFVEIEPLQRARWPGSTFVSELPIQD